LSRTIFAILLCYNWLGYLERLVTAPYPVGHNRKLQTANQSPQLF